MYRAYTPRPQIFAVLLGIAASCAIAADQPYWVCVDEQGKKIVQDEACAYAPDAAPSGRTVVPRPPASKVRVPVQDSVQGRGMDVGAFWRRTFENLLATLKGSPGADGVPKRRALYIGIGVAGLALLSGLVWMELWPRLRRRRLEREARDQRDPYQAALGEMVQDAELKAAQSAPAPPQLPMRWTPTVLRDLAPPQFGALCLRLWQLRGLRAEATPGKRLGDTLLLLRHPAQPDLLHGVVVCRARRAEMLGWDAAQDVSDQMQQRGCAYGALMSPGDFDLAARDYVRGKSIELKGSVTLMAELDALTDERRAFLLRHVILVGAAASAPSAAAAAAA